jgi:hypothetical protein
VLLLCWCCLSEHMHAAVAARVLLEVSHAPRWAIILIRDHLSAALWGETAAAVRMVPVRHKQCNV